MTLKKWHIFYNCIVYIFSEFKWCLFLQRHILENSKYGIFEINFVKHPRVQMCSCNFTPLFVILMLHFVLGEWLFFGKDIYRYTFNISRTKSPNFLASSCSCIWPIHWSQVLSRAWRYSWSNADRRYSNYIWVIYNCIAYKGATYIRVWRYICLHPLEIFWTQVNLSFAHSL